MPKQLEKKLKKQIDKKYPKLSKERKNAILYSILRKTGWKPGEGEETWGLDLTDKEKEMCDSVMADLYKELQ